MSAWATVTASKAASLSEIMVDQEFLASDLSLAEVLSFEEIHCASDPLLAVNHEELALVDDDADFAMALALQEQLYDEELTRKYSKEHTGNVRIALPEHALQTEGRRPVADYEDYGAGGDAAVDKALRLQAQKQRVKGVEVAGRISAKDFKSTAQGVLDPATNLLIFQMLQNGTLSRCDTKVTVKTGKEASVFYGELDFTTDRHAGVSREHFIDGCAVKIFKTTLNEFSNRSDYYDGDHRFGKFNKIGSTREAIAKWAEKEFRNLTRVNKRSRIFAPQAVTYKDHIVIMSFVGSGGVSAPQLREVPRAIMSVPDWTSVYFDTVTIVYSLYQDCKLVHGDLSEYNLLWHGGETWVIDFGQAVDTSHPDHMSLMIRDIQTINNFFERNGVGVLDPNIVTSIVMQSVAALDVAFSSRVAGAPVSAEAGNFDDDARYALIKRIILQYVD